MLCCSIGFVWVVPVGLMMLDVFPAPSLRVMGRLDGKAQHQCLNWILWTAESVKKGTKHMCPRTETDVAERLNVSTSHRMQTKGR